jgi:hypothetical protein
MRVTVPKCQLQLTTELETSLVTVCKCTPLSASHRAAESSAMASGTELNAMAASRQGFFGMVSWALAGTL